MVYKPQIDLFCTNFELWGAGEAPAAKFFYIFEISSWSAITRGLFPYVRIWIQKFLFPYFLSSFLIQIKIQKICIEIEGNTCAIYSQ